MAIQTKKTKDGEKRYIVRVRDTLGGFFHAKTFVRKTDAERHERQLLDGRDRGDFARPRALRALTVEDFFAQWKAEDRSRVSDGWKKSQEEMWRLYLKPTLGSQKVAEVRSNHVAKMLSMCEQLGRSPQTRRHVYNLCNRIFRYAVDCNLVALNPVAKVNAPKVPPVNRAYLSPDESRRLLLASRSHFLGRAIWLGLLTGLRPSEVQALRYEAVDFEVNQITICAAFKRKVGRIEPFPKGQRVAYVPMPPDLADFLRVDGRSVDPSGFVAPGKKGGMLSYRVFLDGLANLCRKVQVRVVTPHELRHSCTELYVSAGASEVDISRLLNHRSLASTRRYMHRSDERLSALAAAVSVASQVTVGVPRLKVVG